MQDERAVADTLADLLEFKQNRDRLFRRYFGERVLEIVLALRARGRGVWRELDSEARKHYGAESNYVRGFAHESCLPNESGSGVS